MAEDPVCAKSVDPEQASCKSEYQGQTYYFCSFQCKQLFDAEPREDPVELSVRRGEPRPRVYRDEPCDEERRAERAALQHLHRQRLDSRTFVVASRNTYATET